MQIYKASNTVKSEFIKGNNCFGLVAVRNLKEGEICFTVSGKTTNLPTRYTVPIAKGVIIDPVISEDFCTEVYYLNHSCDPNACFREGGLCVAARNIKVGEEVTIHYGTLGKFGEEWRKNERTCFCGTASCPGWVKGFDELGNEERIRLDPFIQEWVKSL